jgi:hypothetical protein
MISKTTAKEVNISITYTPNALESEPSRFSTSEKELIKLVKDTLKDLKKQVRHYRGKLHGALTGKMAVINYLNLSNKPLVKLDFPIWYFEEGSNESRILWRAEIVLDERDWVYLASVKGNSPEFIDELNRHFEIKQKELRV